ncbi:MAG: hypothetical protein NFCOHLIN_02976 [Gammaproteobacteria bacterium]|nr:hypothetical protein [Gammaproteobacteria bacterium]
MNLDRVQDLLAIAVVVAVAAWYVRSALRARRNAAAGGCRSACGGCAARSSTCPDPESGPAGHSPR